MAKKKSKKQTRTAPSKKIAPPIFPELSKIFFPEPLKEEESWNKLWIWLAVAFVLRAIIALGGNFLLHPDEIMQYLEPAHKAVYGYGVTYWEFYYGARSWLVPSFVAIILWCLEAIGLGQPIIYVYVVKLIFCVTSLLIPWGSYHIARYFYTEKTARVALILTCLWPYLVVFGHKPFTEFVATSAFFGIFGYLTQARAHKVRGAIITGFLLAFVPALRIQYIFIPAITWLVFAFKQNLTWIGISFLSGLVMLVLVGIFEVLTWGGDYLFHSYYFNIIMNIMIAEFRPPEPWYFFLHRLLFTSAGLVLLSLFSFVIFFRKNVLLCTLFFVMLLFHMAQVHKELRFIFLIHPIILITAAPVLVEIFNKLNKNLVLHLNTVFASIFLFIISFNVIDDRWLHLANSGERTDQFYLRNQSNMFDIYFDLSKDDNLKGLLHLGEAMYNTPGFYYLHKNVPFYQSDVFSYIQNHPTFPKDKTNNVFSHVIFNQDIQIAEYSKIISGDYNLYQADEIIDVAKLKTKYPIFVDEQMHAAITHRNLSKLKLPVYPEWED